MYFVATKICLFSFEYFYLFSIFFYFSQEIKYIGPPFGNNNSTEMGNHWTIYVCDLCAMYVLPRFIFKPFWFIQCNILSSFFNYLAVIPQEQDVQASWVEYIIYVCDIRTTGVLTFSLISSFSYTLQNMRCTYLTFCKVFLKSIKQKPYKM